jgi:hypothetical protein
MSFETGDHLKVEVDHKPEADNDFVVLRYTPTDGHDGGGRLYLQPGEAISLARYLLNTAHVAAQAQLRYLEGKR